MNSKCYRKYINYNSPSTWFSTNGYCFYKKLSLAVFDDIGQEATAELLIVVCQSSDSTAAETCLGIMSVNGKEHDTKFHVNASTVSYYDAACKNTHV